MHARAAVALLLMFLSFSAASAEAIDVLVVGPKGEHRFSAAELAAMPQVAITVSDHGAPAAFEGVVLQALLEQVGAPDGEHLRGKELTRYVLIEARDGYRALFSLAELSSAFTDRKTILASRRDGKTLTEEEGPFRIAVEGEKKMGRSVRQVKTIRLLDAP